MIFRNAKKDSNQDAVVSALRNFGAVVLHTHQLKNAFDILVGYRGKLFIMEIKSGNGLPKQYTRERLEKSLTEGERDLMNQFKRVGVDYHIIVTVEEAINILNK